MNWAAFLRALNIQQLSSYMFSDGAARNFFSLECEHFEWAAKPNKNYNFYRMWTKIITEKYLIFENVNYENQVTFRRKFLSSTFQLYFMPLFLNVQIKRMKRLR